MVKVTYDPGPAGNKTTTFQGRTVEAGKAFDIDDSTDEGKRQLAKARANPHFTVTGGKRANEEPVEAEPDQTPKSATQSPMFADGHLKQEVRPGGTMTEEQATDSEEMQSARAKADEEDKPRRGRPRK